MSKEKLFKAVNEVLPWAMRYKKLMLKKGLRKAKCKCKREGCKGTIYATLNGRKDHLHLACTEGACYYRMME